MEGEKAKKNPHERPLLTSCIGYIWNGGVVIVCAAIK